MVWCYVDYLSILCDDGKSEEEGIIDRDPTNRRTRAGPRSCMYVCMDRVLLLRDKHQSYLRLFVR